MQDWLFGCAVDAVKPIMPNLPTFKVVLTGYRSDFDDFYEWDWSCVCVHACSVSIGKRRISTGIVSANELTNYMELSRS
jgi:hypothetical protein